MQIERNAAKLYWTGTYVRPVLPHPAQSWHTVCPVCAPHQPPGLSPAHRRINAVRLATRSKSESELERCSIGHLYCQLLSVASQIFNEKYLTGNIHFLIFRFSGLTMYLTFPGCGLRYQPDPAHKFCIYLTRFRADCQLPTPGRLSLWPTQEEKQGDPQPPQPLLAKVLTDSIIRASSLIADMCAIQVTFLQLCYSAIIGFLVLIGP